MNTRSLSVCFLLIVMTVAACTPSATPAVDVAKSPLATETAVGTDEAGFYPLSTRTGVANIDVVLAAVESGESQQLRDLLRFMNVACTNADGLGGPPKCRDGEAEGGLVDVFPFLGSEGSYLYREDLDIWTGIDVTSLYAIYHNSENRYSDQNFPIGEYAILLLSKDNFPGVELQISDGQVVRIDAVFDTSMNGLAEYLSRSALDYMLAPK